MCTQATLDDVGKGLGPAIVAALIAGTGRRVAFNLAVCGWLPCGALLCAAGTSIGRDEAAMNVRLRAAVVELTDRCDAFDAGAGDRVPLVSSDGGPAIEPDVQ